MDRPLLGQTAEPLGLGSAGSASAARRVGPLAEDPQGLLALLARDPVEDQDAVEVVHLVLEDARVESGRLDRMSSPCWS